MEHELIRLARESILEVFDPEQKIDRLVWLCRYPELSEERAVFVTLNAQGNLRGCIGSLLPHRSLLEEVIANAKAAAFRDPRFAPLSMEEFETIDIELSLLSLPYELEYSDVDDLKHKIRPGIDGVILRLGDHQATFLPSVWEQLPSFELFFEHLCHKAGLEGLCLQQHPEISLYQAKKIV
jgi:uncharacterized protein